MSYSLGLSSTGNSQGASGSYLGPPHHTLQTLSAGFTIGDPGFAAKGLPELRHVHHDAVDRYFGRRMRIGDGARALILGTIVFAGPLREATKKR